MGVASDRAIVMHALDALVNGARHDVWKQLVGNLVIALAWLLGGPHRTVGPINEPAKALFGDLPVYPMRVWGALLLLATGLTLVAFLTNHATFLKWSFYVLAAYWGV